MGVRKFRSIEEAKQRASKRLEGANLRSAVELSELCLHLSRVRPPQGVHRFTSIEQAQEDRRRWQDDLPSDG